MGDITKYFNQKITVNGETFDSKKEYRRFCELKLLEKAGVIANLRRQITFELIPTIREPETIGKRGGIIKGKVIERGVDYIADFVYDDLTSGMPKTVVEDTKGFRTKDYIIKRKLMLWRYQIKINEV